MDEARQVVERLERIDALKGRGAAARELLAEVRLLLAEGERWLAAERAADGFSDEDRASTGRAEAALSRCRALVDAGPAAGGSAVSADTAVARVETGDAIRREVAAGAAV
jgi:hypothetical protein